MSKPLYVSMETQPLVHVDTSTCQCQVPKESLKSHFLASSQFSLAGAELLLLEKGPPLKEQEEASARGFQSRQVRKKVVDQLHSSNNTSTQVAGLRGEASLDREAREQIHFTLLGALLLKSSDC